MATDDQPENSHLKVVIDKTVVWKILIYIYYTVAIMWCNDWSTVQLVHFNYTVGHVCMWVDVSRYDIAFCVISCFTCPVKLVRAHVSQTCRVFLSILISVLITFMFSNEILPVQMGIKSILSSLNPLFHFLHILLLFAPRQSLPRMKRSRVRSPAR